MHCSHCGQGTGVVFEVNGKSFCAACWREQLAPPGSLVTVTASNCTIPYTFAPGGWLPPAPAPLPEAAGTASEQCAVETVICGRCHQQRAAEHAAVLAIGKVLVSSYFVCGPCLDELAEALYRDCAKRGVGHWRKKEHD